MAEEKTTAGGVTITTGEKTVGQKAQEAVPFYGNYLKTKEAAGKLSDGADGSEVSGLASEGAAFIGSLGTSAFGIATDPIGWLVGQGLNFLISVVQPIEDTIHIVSGDGPALAQAAENFNAIAEGVAKLRQQFEEELKNTIQSWGGPASEVAGTKLGEFANGIDGVAGQAGEVARLLQISSMIMTIVEDFVKAILTELITWLVMIWVPALAAAAPSFGASTAAAGAATAARVATTGSRVSQVIAKLRTLLDKFLAFLRNLASRLGNVRTAFQRSMVQKRVAGVFADMNLDSKKSPLTKLWGTDGMLGERLQGGFGKSMFTALSDTAVSQLGLGTRTNAGIDKPLRNAGNYQKAGEYDDTGTDQSLQETRNDLEI
ncbi:hypothetical protein [Saccharomonospora xinjiangensis]|uniref:Uncharacterized protein n=1 Tax=Saccharomonospora xinjiangensis XJ-54 TaxID=882086 RepID=I0V173_9PSEU|nr:hypothetical protein [Saccharomonospora xinjiangensis]EID53876.1 hypothetical protein SacxiDRAFT_1629 [Saccharomonospora xinjiangensis XJ-54]